MNRRLIDCGTAFSKVIGQPYKTWPASNRADYNAGSRFYAGGYFPIEHNPRFSISREDKVFTIGSCFARNVEEYLVMLDVDVATAGFSLPPERYAAKARPSSALNKYSTASILSQIEDVLVYNKPAQNSMIDMGDGNWFDPHASNMKPADIETVMDTRSRITNVTRSVLNSDVVFITLGLTESWLDQETGLVLNVAPPVSLYRRHPGRFAWFNAGFEDSFECMERVLKLIWNLCRQDMRVIVTVSPVPLNVTFSGRDIVVANSYSKSVLRAVADALYQKYDLVDYYPSFEMVVNSPRDITWEEDQVHVKGEAVRSVISRFTELYFH